MGSVVFKLTFKGGFMKFGYFCNTTNWTHKPYHRLLDETKEITEYCDQNKGIQYGLQSITSIMKEWKLVQIH